MEATSGSISRTVCKAYTMEQESVLLVGVLGELLSLEMHCPMGNFPAKFTGFRHCPSELERHEITLALINAVLR